MLTVYPQYCPLPALMHGTKCKIMLIDADSLEEAEKANDCAVSKGWTNYLGGVSFDDETGKPGVVMFKPQ